MNLFKIFADAGHELWLVGGAVRDQAQGKRSNDLDYATSALPEETIRILKANRLKVIPVGVEFGTIQTIIDNEKVEVTTYRCDESYTMASRKPSVVFGSTIEQDLMRRDFTFNAMSMDEDGHIFDPFGGKRDLRKGIICTPGDPTVAFTDDPLRMLRCARFKAQGYGQLEVRTHQAMVACRKRVLVLSGERIFEEMTKMLLSPSPEKGLRLLDECGILEVLFPALHNLVLDGGREVGDYHHLSVWKHTLAVVTASAPIAEQRWAALFHDTGKPQCRTFDDKDGQVHFFGHEAASSRLWIDAVKSRHLVVPNVFRDKVTLLIREHMAFVDSMGIKGVRRMMHRLGDQIENLIDLHYADIISHHPDHQGTCLENFSRILAMWCKIEESPERSVNAKFPKGTGAKVAEALGIKPGVRLGKVMKALHQMVVDGDLAVDDDVVRAAKKIKT